MARFFIDRPIFAWVIAIIVMLGGVLAMAMVGTLFVAAVMGTLIPLFLRWLKVDPALASSVFVTTATDVSGFLLFLGLGTFFLARLQ